MNRNRTRNAPARPIVELAALYIAFFMLAVLFAGCGLNKKLRASHWDDNRMGFRPVQESLDQRAAALRTRYSDNAWHDTYKSCTSNKKQERNKIIDELMFMIDVDHARIKKSFFYGKAGFDTLSDWAQLGLAGAGAMIGSEGTKTTLAIVSGLVSGSKLSVDKNFLAEKTSFAIIKSMEAARAEIRNEIRTKMKREAGDFASAEISLSTVTATVGDQTIRAATATIEAEEARLPGTYTLDEALQDLVRYHFSGTLVGGLEAIAKLAGKEIDEIQGRKLDVQDFKNGLETYLGMQEALETAFTQTAAGTAAAATAAATPQ